MAPLPTESVFDGHVLPPPGVKDHGTAFPAPVIAYLAESLGREGFPVGEWADRAGMPSANLTPDLVATFPQAVEFIAQVVRAMPERPIGLQVGARPLLQSFGMLGVAVQTAEDVGTAIGVGLQYHQAAGSLVDFDLEIAGDAASMKVVPRTADGTVLPFVCEETLLSSLTLLRSALADEHLVPRELRLAYPAPPYAAAYAEHFGCPVRFGAQDCRMTMPRDLLGRRLPRSEPHVHAAALTVCRTVVDTRAAAPEVDFAWAVEQLLRSDVKRAVTMAAVARQLRTTERTLRRHLAESGETFRSIHTRVRLERAERLLLTTDLPIRVIADEVGFGDARDFRRAYIAWTGRTPAEARA
ncbi:AraC family transcriptional regulator [Tsukamurella sp. 1534]|uniref:AraC family transcriptional regulator n=1 Tax=Tsukamurella sp. 1534 TaxID=1151061 RepID=UPI00030CD4A8|nr:AraC family transcriptional regulator [Tsukamurella sp. 1534]